MKAGATMSCASAPYAHTAAAAASARIPMDRARPRLLVPACRMLLVPSRLAASARSDRVRSRAVESCRSWTPKSRLHKRQQIHISHARGSLTGWGSRGAARPGPARKLRALRALVLSAPSRLAIAATGLWHTPVSLSHSSRHCPRKGGNAFPPRRLMGWRRSWQGQGLILIHGHSFIHCRLRILIGRGLRSVPCSVEAGCCKQR
eukprot:COSAG06_NODE_2757_length_6335_cov_3.434734_5_plen_204_part_00